MKSFSIERLRLSDRILTALELALEQNDLEISELLNKALDLSMTRNAGGGEFIERRDYPLDVEKAIDELRTLQDKERVTGKKA